MLIVHCIYKTKRKFTSYSEKEKSKKHSSDFQPKLIVQQLICNIPALLSLLHLNYRLVHESTMAAGLYLQYHHETTQSFSHFHCVDISEIKCVLSMGYLHICRDNTASLELHIRTVHQSLNENVACIFRGGSGGGPDHQK